MTHVYKILCILVLLAIAVKLWLGPIMVQEIHYHYGPEFKGDRIEYKNTDLRAEPEKPLKLKIPDIK